MLDPETTHKLSKISESSSSLKVHLEVGLIRRGGGPPGYCYNFLKGIDKILEQHRIPLQITTPTPIVTSNTQHSSAPKRKMGLMSYLLSASKPSFLKDKEAKRLPQWNQVLSSDIAIFHGYQNPNLIRAAKSYTTTVYMPHCPTIAADEIKITAAEAGTPISKYDYAHAIEVERELFRNADIVVFASEHAKTEYLPHFSDVLKSKTIVHIHSGIDFPAQSEKPSLADSWNPELPRVLYAGRFTEHKGFDLFAAAATEITRKSPGVKFYSIGKGDLPIPDSVINLGWQSNPFQYISAASVIVIPNRTAYFDLFPLECASLGKPMVMSEVGGNIDQLKMLPDTIPCAPNDVHALANSIIDALDRSQRDSSWGNGNAIAFAKHFDSDIFASRWIEFIFSDLAKSHMKKKRSGQ